MLLPCPRGEWFAPAYINPEIFLPDGNDVKRASRLRRARPQRARSRPPRTPKRSRTPPEGSNEVAAVPGADDERVLPSEPRATLAETAERESPASPRSEDAVSCGTTVFGPPRPARPLGSHLGQAAYSGTSPAKGLALSRTHWGWGAPAPGRTAVVSAAPGPGPGLVCVSRSLKSSSLFSHHPGCFGRAAHLYLFARTHLAFSKIFSALLSYFVACLRLLSWSSSSRLL